MSMSNGAAAIAKVGLNTLVDREIYVLAVQVKTIGDTPLVNHEVRILDPDTGEMVGSPVMTDDEGVVRALVPENKTYRIEIVDEERELPILPLQAYEEPSFLICRFVDESGAPIANTKVEAEMDDHSFEITTDEDGRIDCCAHLGPYELNVESQTFRAHAILSKDREKDENHYRFVVSTNATQKDHAREPEGRLPRYDAPFDLENQDIDV